MKKITFALSLFALALVVSSCGSDSKYTDRLDEIKQTYALPSDAVVIKELGTAKKEDSYSPDDMWCLFVIGGDTILYHNHDGNDGDYESMCRVSWTAVQKTTAEAEVGEESESAAND